MALSPLGSRHQKAGLATAAEVPEHFISKILQHLKRSRLIESQRGMNGGFTLARDPDRITMLEVIESVEGPTILNMCLSPGPSCSRKNRCPAHTVWVDAQAAMRQVLDKATIGMLAQQSSQASADTGLVEI